MRRTLIALALAGALFAGCGGDDDEPETAATPAPTAEATPGADDGGRRAAAAAIRGRLRARERRARVRPDGDHGQGRHGHRQLLQPVLRRRTPSTSTASTAAVGETVTGGDAPPLTVELEPGEYEFYCPVGGHRAAGMIGHAHRRVSAPGDRGRAGSRRSPRGRAATSGCATSPSGQYGSA